MNRTKHPPSKSLAPPKVRYEPPTVEEAVQAACDLASELEQQVEIAAALIGMSPDEVRPHILRRPPTVARSQVMSTRGAVVVERRAPRVTFEVRRPMVMRTK